MGPRSAEEEREMVRDADPLRFCGSTAVMVAVVDLCPPGCSPGVQQRG